MRLRHFIKVGAKATFALVDPFLGPLPGPRILIYHQVGVDLGREMEVSTRAFRRQLDWMQEHGEIADLETAIEGWDEPDANRIFVLTFDDGFEDVYHNAFPILKERAIPFTLYLTTNPVETGEPLDPRYPDAKPLSWDQVNEMIGTGLVTVGAHTHTHSDLRRLRVRAIEEELDTSNQLIQVRTGIEPGHFTYPWGWWVEGADQAVQERYRSATVGSIETARGRVWERHRIPRLPVQRTDIGRLFSRKTTTGAPTEDRIRRRMHRALP